MRDVIQCHADVLYLKGMLRLPPQPVANVSEQLLERMKRPVQPGNSAAPGIPSAAGRLLALLRRHLDHHATAAAFAGKRSFRRIGG